MLSPFSCGSPLKAATGVSGAAPIWHAAMETILRGRVHENFTQPLPKVAQSGRMFPHSIIEPHPVRWKIHSPLPHSRFRIHPYLPKEHQQILAEVEVIDEEIEFLRWYLDGKLIKETAVNTNGKAQVWIPPNPGPHTLKLVAPNGEKQIIPFRILLVQRVWTV